MAITPSAETPPAGIKQYTPENPPPAHLQSFFEKRTSLFTRFDQGIWLNDEGWYSVTPEHLADQITDRIVAQLRLRDGGASDCSSGSKLVASPKYHLMDAFCGPGGNILSFARHDAASVVTALDISAVMLQIAQHNASIYEIPPGKIRYVEGDILKICDEPSETWTDGRPIDAIFMSPPWGGTKYKKREGDEGYETAPAFDLDAMPVPLGSVVAATKKITPNLAIMLPPTSDPEDVKKHVQDLGVDVEQYVVDGVLKFIVAFTGDLKRK